MENRTAIMLAGLALAVVAGSRLEGPGSGSSAKGAEQTDSAQARKPAPRRNPITYRTGPDLLRAFLGGAPDSAAASAGPKYELEVLVASLPDPWESHLDWSWDAQLEAIRRGFEASGFVTDRFWFPKPGDSTTIVTRQDTVKRVAAQVRPGIILFRRADPDSLQLRLLYVVGELPTSGVHKRALAAALEERAALYRDTCAWRIRAKHRLRIIGPTFSGSALSLRLTLLARLRQADTVEIVSGSATDLSNLRTLSSTAGPVLRFSATVHPNEDMNEALKRLVLEPLDIEPREVALLRESSTQYGSSVAGAPSYFDVPFPMSISNLRAAYLKAPAVPASAIQSPSLSVTPSPKLPLTLEDQTKPRENLPVASELTPPSLDLVFDDIARTLTRHGIRLVGLLATDVRDKLFLGAELRKRMRDVQLFTYESSVLYLRPEHNQALRGMLVLSTYPLAMESQWWTLGPPVPLRLSFSTDAAEGTYNATLFQLANPGAALDYRSVKDSANPRPDIWLSTVGRSSFLPLDVLSHGPFGDCYLAVPEGAPGACPGSDSLASGNDVEPAASSSIHSRLGAAGGLPFFAIMASALLLGLLAWFSWASERPDTRSLRDLLPAPFLPGEDLTLTPEAVQVNADARRLLSRVLDGSLLLHERLYRALAVLAVFGVFLDVSAIRLRLWWDGGEGRPVWLLVAALVALVSLISLGQALGTAWDLFCRYGQDAVTYALKTDWGTRTRRRLWLLEGASRGVVLLFGIMYLCFNIWFVVQVWSLGASEDLRFNLFFHRASQIGSLASPLLPLLLAGLGYAVWCAWHVRRISLLRRRCTFERACIQELEQPPEHESGHIVATFREDFRRAALGTEQVRWRLFLVMPNPGAIVLVIVIFLLLAWLWGQFGRTFEAIALPKQPGGANAFDWLLVSSICATLFATTWATYRFLAVWDALNECLEGVKSMPMVPAFDRLPAHATHLVRLRLPGESALRMAGTAANQQWIHLRGIYFQQADEFDRQIRSNSRLCLRIEELMRYTGVRDSDAHAEHSAEELRSLHAILREFWSTEPLPGQTAALLAGKAPEGGDRDVADTSSRIRRTFTDGVEHWIKAAEEYLAVQILEYIEWVIRHLRVLALFLLLSLLITTLLLSGYPFTPRQLVKLSFILLLLVTVGSILYVNTQMNRNEVLSRIAKTEPGKVTWDGRFVLNVITFGVLPILTLLGSEFPELRGALFSWLEPLKVILKQ
jgi:hypothetical protein